MSCFNNNRIACFCAQQDQSTYNWAFTKFTVSMHISLICLICKIWKGISSVKEFHFGRVNIAYWEARLSELHVMKSYTSCMHAPQSKLTVFTCDTKIVAHFTSKIIYCSPKSARIPFSSQQMYFPPTENEWSLI